MAASWNLVQLHCRNLFSGGPFNDGTAITLYSSAINQLQLKQANAGLAGELGTPDTYTLQQNYPNPFNPSTTITYQIPEQQLIQLEVYNMLGRKVSSW